MKMVCASTIRGPPDFSSTSKEISRFFCYLSIRFLRLDRFDKKHLGVYVPKYVKIFYNLEPGKYTGGITMEQGEVTGCSIQLTQYRRTLRGRLPPNKGQ